MLTLEVESNSTAVKAMLHNSGDGSVLLADPCDPLAPDQWVSYMETARRTLQDFGYPAGRDEYFIQSLAKLWFANHLGSCLTVFPESCALSDDLCGILQRLNTEQISTMNHNQLAFFLPITSRGRGKARKYGHRVARGIFKGGGPFMLESTPDLTARALRRLGYLDDELNSEVGEAMFCFINSTENKKALRQTGCLPVAGEKSCGAEEKLHAAFLSHASPGRWQVSTRTTHHAITQLLKRSSFLAKESEFSRAEIFAAMQTYLEYHHLPPVQTFNGRARRIMIHSVRDASHRGVIEIQVR